METRRRAAPGRAGSLYCVLNRDRRNGPLTLGLTLLVRGGFFPQVGKLSPQRITTGLTTPTGAARAHREWVAVLGENKRFELRLNLEKMSPRHRCYLID